MVSNIITDIDAIRKTRRPDAYKPKNNLINMLTADINNPGDENVKPADTLPIHSLVPYTNHPFRLYEGERLADLVRSIKELGILLPVIVRPLNAENEIYEILSGHNRVNAAKMAGLTEVPVIIKHGLTDKDAKLIVTETNLIQRSFADLSHSERAVAIKEHMDAISGQGKRNDLLKEIENLLNTEEIKENETSALIGRRLESREKTAEKYGLCRANVSRYMRLSYIIQPLINRVDDDEIGLYPAVSLSYLSHDEQTELNRLLGETAYKIDMKKAESMREFSENKKLTNEKMIQILSGELYKKPKSKTIPPLKIKAKIYQKYFDTDTKPSEMEVIIDKALAMYFANKEEKEGSPTDEN